MASRRRKTSTGSDPEQPKPVPGMRRSSSQSSMHGASSAAGAPYSSDDALPVFPGLKHVTFDNGFQVFMLEARNPPDRLFVRLNVAAGAVDEEDDQQGLAHFLEHMVFKGTAKYDNQDTLQALFADWGMSWGGDSNATTLIRNTTYEMDVPVERKKPVNLDKALDVLREMMFHALFRDEDVIPEREVVLAELDTHNNVHERKMKHEHELMHHNCKIGKRLPSGLNEQVAKFTASDLRRFYRAHYQPCKMTLFMAGNVPAAVAIDAARTAFASQSNDMERLAESVSLTRPLIPPSTLKDAPFAVFQHELLDSFHLQVHRLMPMEERTTRSQVRIDLKDQLVHDILSERIAMLRSASHPGFLSIGWMFVNESDEACAVNTLDVYAHPRDWRVATHLAFVEIAKMVKHSPSESEVYHAKETLLVGLRDEIKNIGNEPSESLIDGMLGSYHDGSTLTRVDTELALAEEMLPAITAADLHAVARDRFSCFLNVLEPDSGVLALLSGPTEGPKKTFNPENVSKTSVGPRDHTWLSDTRVLRKVIRAALADGLASAAHEMHVPTHLVSDEEIVAIAKAAKAGWVGDAHVDKASGIWRRRLSNGIGVSAKQVAFDKGWVSVELRARGGAWLARQRSQMGMTSLALDILLQGGCVTPSGEQLRWIPLTQLHQLKNISVGSDYDSETTSVSCSFPWPSAFHAFATLFVMLSMEQLPPQGEAAFQRRRGERKKSRQDSFRSLGSVNSMELDRIKTANADHRFCYTPLENYDTLTAEQCWTFFRNQWRRGAVECLVVGDYDLDSLTRFLSLFIGSLRLRPEYPAGFFTDHDPRAIQYRSQPIKVRTTVQDKEAPNRAWIRLAYQGVNLAGPNGKHFPHRARALVLAVKVLNIQLNRHLRNNLGLLYDVYASWSAYDLYDGGFFYVTMFCDVNKVERCLSECTKLLREFVKKTFTDDEFEQARKPLLASYATRRGSSISWWLASISNMWLPASYKTVDSFNSYLPFMENLKPDTVREIVRKWMNFTTPAVSVSTSVAGEEHSADLETASTKPVPLPPSLPGGSSARTHGSQGRRRRRSSKTRRSSTSST